MASSAFFRSSRPIPPFAKQRRESIEQYRQARRDDLANNEAQELAIIEEYLP
ncbi:MAG TPA: hypothetical protein DDZ80_26580, partial [Cyanobacteria bacterium UBA8803]|nr:hypothetical protein [Cyanobacteria bacterium UBA8803]